MEEKASAEKAVREIRRKTRRRFSAEEKIRIVIEGLRETLQSLQPDVHGEEYLAFPNEAGGIRDTSNSRTRVFEKLVREAFGRGRRIAPHCLRHTFASLHLARGTNLKWVQETGGWASAEMLLGVDGHFMPTESQGYADALTHLNGPQCGPYLERHARRTRRATAQDRETEKSSRPGDTTGTTARPTAATTTISAPGIPATASRCRRSDLPAYLACARASDSAES